ncbi:39S ribosomal protein L19, mitochondrial [Pseudolycoriella hygida]|uniref:Large ribosomal subunit protein bL19m n=1 Tax=Pseudolycoriella hygida TaxID=35572 RepID=A0A9Q0MQ11_9DIPT|nr:39S ribosomal protein L19, mitochondrial [Pseudolycoriella hygida]
MNLTRRIACNPFILKSHGLSSAHFRLLTSKSDPLLEPALASSQHSTEARKPLAPPQYRFVYPEFLPDPNRVYRNPIREKLERMDMINRRTQIDIPEFYVGSILAVTSSDPHAAGKTSRFLGICIQRKFCGLRAEFVLRNYVDNQGVEITYQLYDPTIQKIDIIRLEKRLDSELLYLRDAYPEYSTFDLNMEPEILPEGSPVPLNKTMVKLKPRPWEQRWERKNFVGVSNILEIINEKMTKQMEDHKKPWEKYDLVMEYRKTIPEEEQQEIYAEVYSQLHELEIHRRKIKRSRSFIKPKKLG